jgi:hypothetical protein
MTTAQDIIATLSEILGSFFDFIKRDEHILQETKHLEMEVRHEVEKKTNFRYSSSY